MRKIKDYDFMELFAKFIKDSESGRRLQKNGKRLRTGTVQNYRYLQKLLLDFTLRKSFPLRIKCNIRLSKREFASERKYWKKFYRLFTEYLYEDIGCFDNYVGSNIKMLRTFFNYLGIDRNLSISNFHKQFRIPKEEIAIIVLSPEQLNFLIYDIEFDQSLSNRLKKTKDIFVFGCTVALRISDLMRLTHHNLEIVGENHYLKALSKKTQIYTRIKLPEYAVNILARYKRNHKTLLPKISLFNLNKNIRLLVEEAGWTQPYLKSRSKLGKMIPVKKKNCSEEIGRFCDMVSSHTMRRTAITTMLSLGMPEHLVRKISGHSANSKEFFRYVSLSQLYVDGETQSMFKKLEEKTLFKTLKTA